MKMACMMLCSVRSTDQSCVASGGQRSKEFLDLSLCESASGRVGMWLIENFKVHATVFLGRHPI